MTRVPTFASPGNDAAGDDGPSLRRFVRVLATVINNILQGKINVVPDADGGGSGTFTLTANAASTVLTDSRLGYFSTVHLDPLTANAAGALATTYVTQANRLPGAWTFTHTNNAQTDKTFRVAILG